MHCRYPGPYYLAVIVPVFVLGHGGRVHRDLWMDSLGMFMVGRARAHMVGHSAGMGEILLVGEPEVARCATSVVGSKKADYS
jgi:hypothetical protein